MTPDQRGLLGYQYYLIHKDASRTRNDEIGQFLRKKYREIAKAKGTHHAAYLLRRQGVPLAIARAILL